MHQNLAHGIAYDFQTIEEAFPGSEQGLLLDTDPLPHLVLMQIRRAKKKTAGGIELPDEVLQAEAANTQVAKVLAIGKNCFRHPDTGHLWPEGAWFEVGNYLRIPRYNGFRYSQKWKVPKAWGGGVEDIGFVMFEPIQLIGRLRGDPRGVTSYV